ncbi:MAG: glycosyltransferase family 2 protein [Caldilineaceae bacterium]|nr:glycosyltransferase family 2 protein [Caldilineaceae bacterium]
MNTHLMQSFDEQSLATQAMTAAPLVYIVMPVYNQWDNTAEALASLLRMSYRNFQILVVDNASQDQTAQQLAQAFPTVQHLALPTNLGFAGAVNLGIDVALAQGAEFVLMINNDVWVDPAMLTELVAAMDMAAVGAVGPAIYYAQEPTLVWSAGYRRHPLLLELRGGYRGQPTPAQWQEPFPVDYLLGTAILLRRSLIEAVGKLDPRFFFTTKIWTTVFASNRLAFTYPPHRWRRCGTKFRARLANNRRFRSTIWPTIAQFFIAFTPGAGARGSVCCGV